MNENLTLHVPRLDELSYRQKLMADPETMRYNSGYDMDFPGYHRDTGCIDFPESDWADWHAYFVGQEPERFYAYVVREADGAFVGEVNVHRAPGEDTYDMGIVIEAKHRGRGYAVPALKLLLRHAFEEMGARAVRNDFEETRAAALRAHLACGFERVGCENGIVRVRITRDLWAVPTPTSLRANQTRILRAEGARILRYE